MSAPTVCGKFTVTVIVSKERMTCQRFPFTRRKTIYLHIIKFPLFKCGKDKKKSLTTVWKLVTLFATLLNGTSGKGKEI